MEAIPLLWSIIACQRHLVSANLQQRHAPSLHYKISGSSLGACKKDDDLSAAQESEAEDNNFESTKTLLEPPHKRFLLLEIRTFMGFFAMFLSFYDLDEITCEPLLGVMGRSENSKEIESLFHPYVTRIVMVQSLIGSIIPAVLSLLIGPWSDKFGRRPVLLTAFAGATLGHIITLVLGAISTSTLVNPWIFIISAIPGALTCGSCAINTASSCFISDVTPIEDKPRRMFFQDLAMGVGLISGNICSSYILVATNYVSVFAISAAVMLTALIYIIIVIKESLKSEQIETGSKIKAFFRFGLIKDLFRTCTARRENYDRAILITSALALIVNMFVLESENTVFYLFLRKKFQITLREFTYYTSAGILVKIFGCAFSLGVLKRFFKLSLVTLAVIGVAAAVLDSSVRASAQEFWEMYLAMGFGSMSGTATVMMQSLLSIIVPPTEIGKVFALTNALTTVNQFAGAPLYTAVYAATLDTYPGAFNIMSASFYVITLICLIVVWKLQRTSAKIAAQASNS